MPPEAELTWQRFAYAPAVSYLARAIGAARTGKIEVARAAVGKLEEVHAAFVKTPIPGPYDWTTQVAAMKACAASWLAWAEGRKDDALELARTASELDEKSGKHAVTPGSVLPPRELLGDMLLEMNRPAEALEAYETSLKSSPNRLNGLYGAGRAAELSGDKSKAKKFYAQVAGNCAATSTRKEVREAREKARSL
jgi:tetratricopeptide (TPR) repeat protein